MYVKTLVVTSENGWRNLQAWYVSVMNVKQFARLGGKARAEKLSKARRIEIASIAGKASALKRTSKQDANSQPNEKITENKV